MIGQVLILDVETTGLDPSKDVAIEVAFVRYSLAHHCVVDAFSTLIRAGGNPAEAVNHIPSGLVGDARIPRRQDAWGIVEAGAQWCQAILAHNGDFDRQFVPEGSGLLELPWIDTCNGVTWPLETKPGSSLITLALEHGLGVVDPHRALNDCMLLARLLTRCHELGWDVQNILQKGLRPRATFQAMVTFDEKDTAKESGFKWEPKSRRWLRTMAVEDAKALPFRVVEVEG